MRSFPIKLLKITNRIFYSPPCNFRGHSTTLKKELTVQTFCNVYVNNLPYNIQLKPLDVHKYHNCDKLRIELIDDENLPSSVDTVKYRQDRNNIEIYSEEQVFNKKFTCNIKIPIKANINVVSQGNITSGFFNGSKLLLKTLNGNITVDKYEGEIIDLTTETGDIILREAILAGSIKASILEKGTIQTQRLQGIEATLQTNNGNIEVDSSYCDSTIFKVNSGNLRLQNIHKNNKIWVKNGSVYLSGLDGQLDANFENVKADIQISRILGDSAISINEEGALILRLSEDCQASTIFQIYSPKHEIYPNVTLISSKVNDNLHLIPQNNNSNCKLVKVRCEKSPVQIQSASWADMLNLNIK